MTSPSYTARPPALRRVQYDPSADGSVTVQAFFETVIVNNDDATDTIGSPWDKVTFTLPADVAAQVKALAETAYAAAP